MTNPHHRSLHVLYPPLPHTNLDEPSVDLGDNPAQELSVAAGGGAQADGPRLQQRHRRRRVGPAERLATHRAGGRAVRHSNGWAGPTDGRTVRQTDGDGRSDRRTGTVRQTDGWTVRQTDGRGRSDRRTDEDGQTDRRGRTVRQTDGRTDGRLDRRTVGQTDGRTDGDGQTYGQTDGQTDRQTDGRGRTVRQTDGGSGYRARCGKPERGKRARVVCVSTPKITLFPITLLN